MTTRDEKKCLVRSVGNSRTAEKSSIFFMNYSSARALSLMPMNVWAFEIWLWKKCARRGESLRYFSWSTIRSSNLEKRASYINRFQPEHSNPFISAWLEEWVAKKKKDNFASFFSTNIAHSISRGKIHPIWVHGSKFRSDRFFAQMVLEIARANQWTSMSARNL